MGRLYSTYRTDVEKQLLARIHHLCVSELKMPSSVSGNYHFYGWQSGRSLFWIHHYASYAYFYMRQERPEERGVRLPRLRIPVHVECIEDIEIAIHYAIDRASNAENTPPLPEALQKYLKNKHAFPSDRMSATPVFPRRPHFIPTPPPHIPPQTTFLPLPSVAHEAKKLAFAAFRAENLPTIPPDDEKIQFLHRVGEELEALYETAISYISITNEKDARRFAAYKMYFFSDATGSLLGKTFDLSRQGGLDLARRGERTVYTLFREMVHKGKNDAHRILERAAVLLQSVGGEDLMALPIYAFPSLSARRVAAIFSLFFLFPSKKLIPLIDNSKRKAKKEEEKEEPKSKNKRTLSFEEKAAEIWQKLKQEIVYPADFTSTAPVPASFSEAIPNLYASKLAVSLRSQEEIHHIVPNPDLLYAITPMAEHRPHLFLQLADGRQVLIVVIPHNYIACDHYVKRARRLHLFCKAHGYGYVCTDGSRSIFEYLRMSLDTSVIAELDAILECEPYIFWEHILRLRERFELPSEQLWAYILQNKLILRTQPFRICKPQKETT